nr:1-phosphatidylinositol-3-phosphate 5-kinase FAB1B-like [Tanacetum cinerariifolium]
IPRRSEPANVSRDFWMPDQSCRVCYECTNNWIPARRSDLNIVREDSEKLRVCNYCLNNGSKSVFTYRLTYYPTEFREQQSVVMETNLDEHKEMLLDAVVQSASDFGYFTNWSLFSLNPDGQPADAKSVDSALTGAQALEEKEDVNDVSDESEVEASSSSSIYATTQQQEDVPEPVDFENNGDVSNRD